MNIEVHGSTLFPFSSDIYPGVGLLNDTVFSFLKNLHTVSHGSCTNLHTHQQTMTVPFSPRSCQHLLIVIFLVIAILTHVR